MEDMEKYVNAVKRNSEMKVNATMDEANAAIDQVNAAHHAATHDLRSASPEISERELQEYMKELSSPTHSPPPPPLSPGQYVRRIRSGSNKRN
jgi:cob(I)alamin adenosyltransferase